MQESLMRKLHDYLLENNLDVYMRLQLEGKVNSYLKTKVSSVDALLNKLLQEDKPPFYIEEACMEELTSELRPSAYLFLSELLTQEFAGIKEQWQKSGILEFETINLIESCTGIFSELGFSEDTIDNQQLRLAIIGTIKNYLDNRK